jgi:pyruvate-formate lyase
MNHLNLNLLEKTPRVERLRKNIVNSKPELCSQRAVIITESYRRTEGEPIIMRRAKALKDLLERMSIFIGDDELIVGHQAEKYRSAPFFPEMDGAWLVAEFDTLETRAVDPFIVSAETIRIGRTGHCARRCFIRSLPKPEPSEKMHAFFPSRPMKKPVWAMCCSITSWY